MSRTYAQRKILKNESSNEFKVLSDNNFSDAHKAKLDNLNGAIVSYTIAPSNAIHKENADLVLTGVPEDDVIALNNAFTNLLVLDETLASGVLPAGCTKTSIKLPLANATTDIYKYKGMYVTIGEETKLIKYYDVTNNLIEIFELSTAPAENTPFTIKNNKPVRIDFLPGNIDLGDEYIITHGSKIYVYGNGVIIKSTHQYYAMTTMGANCYFEGFNFQESGLAIVGSIRNCTLGNIEGVQKDGFKVSLGTIENCTVGNLGTGARGIVAESGKIVNCTVGHLLGTSCAGYVPYWSTIDNCFVGNISGDACIGIDLSMGYRGWISNCLIGNISGFNNAAIASNWYADISDCQIGNISGYDNGGINGAGGYNKISNISIGTITATGIGNCWGIYSSGGGINNCSIESITGTSDCIGYLIDGGVISNCTIGAIVSATGILGGSSPVIINGCQLGNIDGSSTGISVNSPGSLISNCILGDIINTGILSTASNVEGCRLGTLSGSAFGIYLTGAVGNIVSGNTIYGLADSAEVGITIEGDNCLITGNNISSLNGGTAISITGTGTVKKNNIEGGVYVA